MKKNLKIWMISALMLASLPSVFAQSIPTLEMPLVTTIGNNGTGASTAAMTADFRNDALNSNVFSTFTPTSTLTVSFANQQFTGLSYGTANYQGSGFSTVQSTGLVFGISPTLASDPGVQGGFPLARYNKIGVYGGQGGPTNNMFTSNPTATGAQLGTGFNVGGGGINTQNGAVEIFTTAQALYNDTITYPRGSRAYFGNLVLTFSQPVKNPVIHLAGLGGSYNFLRTGGNAGVPSDYISTFFTTELELVNSGLTSTLLSGNALMALSGNNIVNANHVNPNGGSVVDPSEAPFNQYGAATGSIRINGTVQQLVYRVYLQGGSASQFAWAIPGSLISQPRDPFTGDIWYVAASYDKPALQIITGNVYNDIDGLTDSKVAENFSSVGTVPNPTTNIGGVLFANLISGGVVVATQPVAANGAYLFDNVAVGTYTVQISINQGVVGQPQPVTGLPANWAHTGEFNGTGAGSDGTPDGISAPIVVALNDIKSNINFGIERLPDSKNFTTLITTPVVGETILLSTPGSVKFGSLPILTGSDPEDMPTEGVLTGKSVKFTALATVGSSNTPATLRYNGADITLNQIIPNFNPNLLTVFLPSPWAGSGLKFNYAYVDAAGLADLIPALYRLTWSGGGTLPISLSEFIVTKNSCTANLNWKTSNELNSDRFEIEVSTGTNPVYTIASTVLASGSSSTVKSYQFSYTMQPGVVYYFRLKMVDKDGSFIYSTVQTASCSKAGGIVIAPNPVKEIFVVRGMENGRNNILIYGSNGQLVKTQVIAQSQGNVDVSYLAPGMYTVKVTSETGNTVVKKLIKY